MSEDDMPDVLKGRDKRGALLFRLAFGVVVVFAILMSLGRCGATGGVVRNPIKADDVVSVKELGYGCESASDFEKAVVHSQAGESTAWAMIVSEPSCFHAQSMPYDYLWTVLSVKGKIALITPEHTLNSYQKFPEERHRFHRKYWIFVDWLEMPINN